MFTVTALFSFHLCTPSIVTQFYSSSLSSPTHTCAAEDSLALLKEIKALGMRAGVAIKPKTPVDVLFTSGCAAEADMVLIMTVEPGFGGQSFMSDMMPKVEALRAKFPSLLIQVDGGVTTDTIETVAKAGANVIVSGSGIFGAKVPAEAVTTMRNIVNKYCAK